MLHTFYLPLPLPPSNDQPYFCALMNSLSIKKIVLLRLHKMWVHTPHSNMDSCLLPMQCPFFLALLRGTDPPIDTGVCPVQQLAWHHEILTVSWLYENFVVPLNHFQSCLDKSLIEKPMLEQVGLGSFCTSNLLSDTALQQDFVICKAVSKHLMMNILAGVHFA